MKKFSILILCLCTFHAVLHAQIRLPKIISDGMILQRDASLKLWGWASPGEKITVSLQGKQYKATTDPTGNWSVTIPPTPAGGPHAIQIKGKDQVNINNVLFGDVWLCSGQSNMVHQLNIHDVTYASVIANAKDSSIRQFWVPTLTHLGGPQQDIPEGSWKMAVGEDIRPFSAVAYFFAKKIQEHNNVPIGIINASVGGTPIEAWTSEEGFKAMPNITATIAKNKDTAYINGMARRGMGMPRPAPPVDAGLAGDKKWFETSYQPKGWKNINIPGYWEDQGVKDLNGIVWYRKEINIPASMTGKAARVFLGRIVDADELYINGTKVGTTTYMYPQRRYPVPDNVLKPGKNLFVIRVTNNNGKGGFVPDKPYCIFAGTDTVDLKGEWQYKVGWVAKPATGGFGGGGINAQNQPAALYNAMVAPWINYRVKGFCWYQGESNAGNPKGYDQLMHALINDWRNKWQDPTLPFLYAQLPGFMDYNYLPSESNWALIREAQAKALSAPNTAMAVTIDLGEWNDIHPDNKKDVGERMALGALKLAYQKDLVHSGPLYKDAVIDGSKIIVSFDHTGSGLISIDGEELSDFAIAGADKKFVWAKTKIEGNRVLVWSEEVKDPKYVRYAWSDNPINPNLYNKEKLPASPFRTDQ